MHTMTRLLLVLALLALPAISHAQGVSRTERKALLTAVAGNAAASAKTFILVSSGGAQTKVQTGGYNLAVLHFNMDYTSGATAVGLVCSSSDDGGTNLFVLQTCDVAAGACTSSDASWAKAIAAADKKWAWRVDITGYAFVSCVVSVTTGAADDAISVSGYLTTK